MNPAFRPFLSSLRRTQYSRISVRPNTALTNSKPGWFLLPFEDGKGRKLAFKISNSKSMVNCSLSQWPISAKRSGHWHRKIRGISHRPLRKVSPGADCTAYQKAAGPAAKRHSLTVFPVTRCALPQKVQKPASVLPGIPDPYRLPATHPQVRYPPVGFIGHRNNIISHLFVRMGIFHCGNQLVLQVGGKNDLYFCFRLFMPLANLTEKGLAASPALYVPVPFTLKLHSL